MSIQRWDPWRDIVSLREAMNSLLEESFVRPRAGAAAVSSGMLVDMWETDDSFVIETSLAGIKPEDVNISVLGDTLRIQAELKEDEGRQNANWHIRERRSGTFERTVGLPSQVKADEADASFRDGVLKITLPKAIEERPRSIQVKPG